MPTQDRCKRQGGRGPTVPGRLYVVICNLSVVLFVTFFAFIDTDRAHLVNVTCVDRDNRRCAQENIFDMVVTGAVVEGSSPTLPTNKKTVVMRVVAENFLLLLSS